MFVSREEYLKNPTSASSLSFFKSNTININKKIEIVDKVGDNTLNKYYFKLVHYLDNIEDVKLDDNYIFIDATLEEFSDHINSCYDDININVEVLKEYQNSIVYDKDLWIAIKDVNNNKIIGTIIASFDKDIKEAYIEWLQISKEYRNKGLGFVLVNELLRRLTNKALFVTVSGDVNNPYHPVSLYQRCGFGEITIFKITDLKL
ncbi:MAG: GNAT family N-acetyltransferase [Bacilli bacterium]|nr:GNAT family N-acetyltransferase [Bacilli bacterium]